MTPVDALANYLAKFNIAFTPRDEPVIAMPDSEIIPPRELVRLCGYNIISRVAQAEQPEKDSMFYLLMSSPNFTSPIGYEVLQISRQKMMNGYRPKLIDAVVASAIILSGHAKENNLLFPSELIPFVQEAHSSPEHYMKNYPHIVSGLGCVYDFSKRELPRILEQLKISTDQFQ